MTRAKTKNKKIITGIFNEHLFRAPQGRDLVADWGYKNYPDLTIERIALVKDRESKRYKPKEERLLPEGRLLTVFNTISKGDELWSGTLKLEEQSNRLRVLDMWIQTLQDGIDAKKWASMFITRAPAKLERNGQTIYGALEPYFEAGLQGLDWALTEYKTHENSYDGLYILEDGDKLTVYSNVKDGNIEWQGPLLFNDTSSIQEFQAHERLKSKARRLPETIDAQTWQQYNWQNRPFRLEP